MRSEFYAVLYMYYVMKIKMIKTFFSNSKKIPGIAILIENRGILHDKKAKIGHGMAS